MNNKELIKFKLLIDGIKNGYSLGEPLKEVNDLEFPKGYNPFCINDIEQFFNSLVIKIQDELIEEDFDKLFDMIFIHSEFNREKMLIRQE